MRRARLALAMLAGMLASTGGAPASAAPATTVTAEGGAEGDSNVERVETGPALETERRGAPVLRAGARLEHRGRLWKGGYSVAGSALSRIVGTGDTPAENVVLLAGDLRYVHALGARPVAAGLSLAGADALPLSDDVGARTFRTAGADALLVLRSGDTRALTLTAGARTFVYKPNHDFDWAGVAAGARLDLTLWQDAEATRSLELVATAGFEARAYEATAFASACAVDAEPTPDCFAATSIPRRDRYQHVGATATYSGRIVAAAGYQLSVIDSNSYGQSVVRHRISASATASLPWHWIGTALATLQLDNYIDGLLQQKNLQFMEYTSLDDVNRSSLQLRLARPLSKAWSLEGRGAIWRDVGSNTMLGSYRRELVYFGAIFSK